jgi:hypothetical protein
MEIASTLGGAADTKPQDRAAKAQMNRRLNLVSEYHPAA